ncbi:MAG TPA: hypothetical protein VNJ46_01660 [Gaiellaceae bacterium]|nr:hypothetical protein [Gaiellaceae bacterium]
MRALLIVAATVLAGAAGAVWLAAAAGAGGDPWQQAKAATARYHSLEQAEKAGYAYAGEPCVAEAAGAMGVHAVDQALVGDPALDPLRPEILLYLPDGNGGLKLVGAEYFQVALVATPEGPRPWFGQDDPREQGFAFVGPVPALLGQTFDGPMAGHNPSMPWHYDLHAWLWAENPSGRFTPFNPALSCRS